MIPYSPSNVPEKYDREWLARELASLKAATEAAKDSETMRYLAAEPTKYWAGLKVLADGVNWDPGSGEGEYRRNLANSAWVFLG